MKNLAALKVIAASVFVANPSFESVVAFADGNVFNAEKKNAIEFHKNGNKGMKAHTIERDEVKDLIEEKVAELAAKKAKAGGKAPVKAEPKPAKKLDWNGTTVKEIEAVLDSKDIDRSEAGKKADLIAICDKHKLTPEDVEKAFAELQEGDNK